MLSGIGPDGHIAFNEPGSSLVSRTRIKTLNHDTILANARFFDNDISKVPKQALTVGVATVMDAKEVGVLSISLSILFQLILTVSLFRLSCNGRQRSRHSSNVSLFLYPGSFSLSLSFTGRVVDFKEVGTLSSFSFFSIFLSLVAPVKYVREVGSLFMLDIVLIGLLLACCV